MTPSQTSLQFRAFDAEMFFVKRLKDHGRQVFDGVTDPAIRRERIRTAIVEGRLDVAIIGKNAAGKPETYAACFERHFGEPLVSKPTKVKTP